MKKFIIPAGVLCTAAIAGAIVYKKIKNTDKDNILFYPMGRYVIHTNDDAFDLKKLIDASDIVLMGKVQQKLSPRWNNKENIQPKNVSTKDIIYFDYLITPLKTFKGIIKEATAIRLRAFEGFVGGYTIEDNSQPKLEENQEIIVFLKKGSTKDFKFDDKEFFTLTKKPKSLLVECNGKFENSIESFAKEDLILNIESCIN